MSLVFAFVFKNLNFQLSIKVVSFQGAYLLINYFKKEKEIEMQVIIRMQRGKTKLRLAALVQPIKQASLCVCATLQMSLCSCSALSHVEPCFRAR